MLIKKFNNCEKTETISKEFYNKFSKIWDSPELQEFPSDSYEESINKIENIASKFKTHQSTLKIKKSVNVHNKFSFT